MDNKLRKKVMYWYNNLSPEIRKLLDEYTALFPDGGVPDEWNEATEHDKIEMLKEAIKDKKSITETKLFTKYCEHVIIEKDAK